MPGTSQQKQDDELAKGESLMFFVYRAEYDRRMRNAIVKYMQRIKAYDGKILGISTNLQVQAPAESPWLRRNDWCAVVMSFPTQTVARRWFISEPEVKQQDFPPPSDGFMVFSVPIRYIPKPGSMTFCWTETTSIKDKRSYQANYVDKVTDMFDTKGVNHGLVFIKDDEDSKVDRLKDCWVPHDAHYRLDLFSSEREYWDIFYSDSYQSMRESRDNYSDTTSVVFTIDATIS